VGIHIHHGYWKLGTETKEEAQEQLIRELVARAQIERGARILDVGCGLGGTAVFLNKALGADVTGITISSTQVELGNALICQNRANARVLLMDAEALELDQHFDVVWSVEAISHLSNKRECFRSIARSLDPKGKVVIADWFNSNTLPIAEASQFLEPVERAMLVPKLEPVRAYMNHMSDAGLSVTIFEDLTAKVQKTWDIATELIRKPAAWKFAAAHGSDVVAFLEGFRAMKAGYKSKALMYGMLVAQRD
jgi:tocopherol O-methyltransferase